MAVIRAGKARLKGRWPGYPELHPLDCGARILVAVYGPGHILNAYMNFHARGEELAVLEAGWKSDQAALLILYGRRRIGQTRLLTHWAKSAPNRRTLYWVAELTSSADSASPDRIGKAPGCA